MTSRSCRKPFVRTRFVTVVLLASVALAGCRWLPGVDDQLGISISNATSESLDVYYEVAGEERLVVSLDPGQSLAQSAPFATRCTAGDLVARGADGQEVARRKPPICFGESWQIEESAAPT